MGSARQWLLKMTAGLKPRRLVVYHQQDGLVLEYEIDGKCLPEGMIEPLGSSLVWRRAMSEIKKIALGERIWTVARVCLLKIVPDDVGNKIKVSVLFGAKIADQDRKLIKLFGKAISFSYPELRYVFDESEASDRPVESQDDNLAVIPIKFCPAD